LSLGIGGTEGRYTTIEKERGYNGQGRTWTGGSSSQTLCERLRGRAETSSQLRGEGLRLLLKGSKGPSVGSINPLGFRHRQQAGYLWGGGLGEVAQLVLFWRVNSYRRSETRLSVKLNVERSWHRAELERKNPKKRKIRLIRGAAARVYSFCEGKGRTHTLTS